MKKSVDLQSLLFVFKKYFIWILLITIIVGVVGAFGAKILITPLYSSSIEVFVNNKAGQTDSTSTITNSDIQTSQELTATYIVFMKNNEVLGAVQKEMNINYPDMRYSAKQIKKMLSFEQINDSMWIKITALTPDKKYSQALCESVATNAMKVIKKTTGVENIKVVGTATLADSASSPNIPMYAILFAVVGFVVSYIIFYLSVSHDNTIDDKTTIENMGLAFFGEIPNLTEARKRAKDYGYKKYGYM